MYRKLAMCITDIAQSHFMSSERIENESYEAVTGTAEETEKGMRSRPGDKTAEDESTKSDSKSE
jgi:hypothetical protein